MNWSHHPLVFSSPKSFFWMLHSSQRTKGKEQLTTTGIRVLVFSPQISFHLTCWLIEYGTSIPRTVLGMYRMFASSGSWSRLLPMETQRRISNYLSCIFQMSGQVFVWWFTRLLFRTSRWRILLLLRSPLVKTHTLFALCLRVYPS